MKLYVFREQNCWKESLLKHIEGYIDIETIEIFFEGTFEKLLQTESITERLIQFGKIYAYLDLIDTHFNAWDEIEKYKSKD